MLATLMLALALPAAALAQGAGDEQYQDPFGGQSTPTPTATPAPTQAPAAPAQSQAPAPTATPAPSAPAPPSGSRRQLPYTGVDAGLVALAGAALLGAGFALRRAVDER